MTGGCSCPIYYVGVVSIAKGSMIIRCKSKCFLGKSCSHISSMTRRESNSALPRPCVKHDSRMYDILPGSCELWKRKYDNSMQITWAYQRCFLGKPLNRSHISSMTRRNRTLLFRSPVSSMTGGCSYPIYYQGVVSIAKGSVIIPCKSPELIKNTS